MALYWWIVYVINSCGAKLHKMAYETTFKVCLIFLLAICLTMLVLNLAPKRQIQAGGCGPRALHAAALTFGKTLTEQQTLDLFPNHGFEVSIGEMEKATPKLGLSATSRQMTVEELKREKPIGVLHIDDVHFVAVAGYEGDAILVVDSLYEGETKPMHWLIDDLKTRWDGVILVVSAEH